MPTKYAINIVYLVYGSSIQSNSFTTISRVCLVHYTRIPTRVSTRLVDTRVDTRVEYTYIYIISTRVVDTRIYPGRSYLSTQVVHLSTRLVDTGVSTRVEYICLPG